MATTPKKPVARLAVKKTYKLFINGTFPRSESGRVYEVLTSKGVSIANPSLASRKDLRDAVVAGRRQIDQRDRQVAAGTGRQRAAGPEGRSAHRLAGSRRQDPETDLAGSRIAAGQRRRVP